MGLAAEHSCIPKLTKENSLKNLVHMFPYWIEWLHQLQKEDYAQGVVHFQS